jgi:PadR family transcriptional regulator, regulatory protein PadR
VNQGSLYTALHRLQHKGGLTSEWRPSETGREAKFYFLTRAGKARHRKESWNRLTTAVRLIFNEGR